MRTLIAALALAGALYPRVPVYAAELAQTAQMARDVTDAVRRQRAWQPPRRNRKGRGDSNER